MIHALFLLFNQEQYSQSISSDGIPLFILSARVLLHRLSISGSKESEAIALHRSSKSFFGGFGGAGSYQYIAM